VIWAERVGCEAIPPSRVIRPTGTVAEVEHLLGFLRNNRLLVATCLVVLVVGSLAFPYLLGLNGGVAVVLLLLVLAVSLGVYRVLNRSPLVWNAPSSRTKLIFSSLAGLVVVGLVIQAVPFGWDRSNPPVTREPDWDSPRTRELAVRACFDCHSNEVEYPWYSKIAPMSWAVQLHVQQGREKVNYSEWDKPQKEGDESAETVIEGEMPPGYYTLLTHGEARLTEAERQELIDGLEATFGSEDHEREEDDD